MYVESGIKQGESLSARKNGITTNYYLWHKAFAGVIIGGVVVHNLNMLSSFTLPTQREAPAGDDCRQSCSYIRKRKTETDSQEQRTGRKLVEILVSL